MTTGSLSLRPRRFRSEDYTVHVQLNDYLDIICPHYEDHTVAEAAMERYTLYLVEHEQYRLCQPRSKDQVRWNCDQPSARHGPEKLSEKFQRFTPFTLGKEFKEGHSYYYICESPVPVPAAWGQASGRHVLRTEPHMAPSHPELFSCICGTAWRDLLRMRHSTLHSRHRDKTL